MQKGGSGIEKRGDGALTAVEQQMRLMAMTQGLEDDYDMEDDESQEDD
jgi:hypothetical protein